MGILLVFALLMTGRLIRHRMLITPDGEWREHLWLDELVLAPGGAERSGLWSDPLRELQRPLDCLNILGLWDRGRCRGRQAG